jgi:hypothetical protein
VSSLLDEALDLVNSPNPLHGWLRGARLLGLVLALGVVAEGIAAYRRRVAEDYGVSPASTRDSTEASTFPPLTTDTTLPAPAAPDNATATGSAPAPSATT